MRRSLAAVICVCTLIATSCGKNRPTSSHKNAIHLNLKREPMTLDPRKGADAISSRLHFALFQGLVRLDLNGDIIPAQAEKYDISSDGMLYTFYLRDALWSDGSPVTAYDFERSWKDILDPLFPASNAHLFYPIKNAEKAKKGEIGLEEVGIWAADAKTFVVTLEKPTPYFLNLIAFCSFFPVSTKNDRAHPTWANDAGEHFLSNGPFVLKEWKHGDEIIIEKNPLYWNLDEVKPDEIVFSMVENEMTAYQLFESGKLDMIGEPLSPLPIDAIASLQDKVHTYPSASTTFVSFHVEKPPFHNAKIRKALAYAIDRRSIVENITQLSESAATSAIPPSLKGNSVRSFFKDKDTFLAKKLLEEGMQECGIDRSAFEGISYLYSASELNYKIAQAIQQQWLDTLGIHIKLEQVEHKVLLDRLTKRSYSLAQSIWQAQYNDPMNILERFKAKGNVKNYPHWENEEYNRLLEDSHYATGDVRNTLLEQAEEIFLEEMPICPIYHWNIAYLAKPHLENIGLIPIGELLFHHLGIGVK
ncbi:MAG: peptide ABC transporter substrate-binding protein [Verrucomicrobia bacterium]|nr:peptide ABC transporter substrate-binding protein [Verrucomicrobiota bacterium]